LSRRKRCEPVEQILIGLLGRQNKFGINLQQVLADGSVA
jgi:hypothetical protein